MNGRPPSHLEASSRPKFVQMPGQKTARQTGAKTPQTEPNGESAELGLRKSLNQKGNYLMKPTKKSLIVTAALAGLLSGTTSRLNAAPQDSGQATKSTKSSKAVAEKHACAGKNSCKGKGGCATDGSKDNKAAAAGVAEKHSCAGKNSCKGNGGCATDGKKK